MYKDNKIFGIHPVLEAVQSDKPIQKILLQKGKNTWAIDDIKSQAFSKNIKIQFLPSEGFKKFDEVNHQGIIAYLSPVNFISIENLIEKDLNKEVISYIILDGVTDVRNLGAIIRSAESMNFDAVIIPENNTATINETTVKTSAGSIFNISLCKVKHISDALMYLQSENFQLIAISEKATQKIYDYSFSNRSALVMGDEGKGVSKKALSSCHDSLRIPLYGKTSSLNVSVASGIAMYEKSKQKMTNIK